jgi:hypothetical protein
MLADYLIAMVRRRPPEGAPVVVGSTPVVAFGEPGAAEVATLGINPSATEFLEDGRLLTGERRRLATLVSIGASELEELSDEQVGQVVSDCTHYFRWRPYKRWFDRLDSVLKAGLDVSYYDGSACHLDLVQWATQPVWGRIPDRAVRDRLLADGTPHLKAQLAHENVRLVLLNGRQVLDQVEAAGLADLVDVGRLPLGARSCSLYEGSGRGLRWLGWSANLQSSYGISREFLDRLTAWISASSGGSPAAVPSLASMSVGTIDEEGHLPRGLHLADRRELRDALERWISESSAETIGDVGKFGGKAWVSVDVGGHEVVLNADTKRAAVEWFLEASRPSPGRPWRVVANRRGRINKVLPDPHGSALPGWYAYLTTELEEEQTI